MNRSALLLALLLALMASPAVTQVVPTGAPMADILLSRAIAEHRVFLTCSALDPATQSRILADWQADVTAATVILTRHRVAPEAIAAFTAAADPQALVPGDDTPWAEVRALCATHPDWHQAYDRPDRVILDRMLAGALE